MKYSISKLIAFLILVLGCATTGQKATQDVQPGMLTAINIIDNQLNIVVDRPFAYTVYKSSDPRRIIVELPDVRMGMVPNVIKKAVESVEGKSGETKEVKANKVKKGKKEYKAKEDKKADEAESDKTKEVIKSDIAEIVEIISSQVEEPLSTRLEILLSAPVKATLIDKDTALVIKVKEEPKAEDVEIAAEVSQIESPKAKEKVAEIKIPPAEAPVKEVKVAEVTKPEEKAAIQPTEVKEDPVPLKTETKIPLQSPGVKEKAAPPMSEPRIDEKPRERVTAKPKERHDKPKDAPEKYAHLRILVVASKKEAEEMLSEIKNGRSLTFLAKERSLDKSRDEYGYLGKVSVESFVEPFLIDTISHLEKGEISGVLNLKDSRYAIVQMVDMSYYDKGRKAFRNKDYKTAEENLLKHVEINPDAVKARIMLGQMYEGRGELEKAEKMYKDAVHYDPNYEKAYVHLGGLYLKLKQYQKAYEVYEKGLIYFQDSESLKNGLRSAKIKTP